MFNQTEEEFRKIIKRTRKKIILPTKKQDIEEHWDIEADGEKFDVKGMRKINRDDLQPTNLFNYVEIKNVRGETGWAYGKADSIAFETQNKWVLVKLTDLQEMISSKVQKTYVKKPSDSLYKLYRREGRKDIITMVNSMDLVEISYEIINKNK